MDLDEALGHVLDGHGLLFTGAGFSLGAVNLRGNPLKTGSEFARHLSALVGLPPDTRLEDAAEEFTEAHGEDKLIQELEQEFTVRTCAAFHMEILRFPWKRIYTTNYDNVAETAAAAVSKRLTPVTLSDKVRDIPKTSPLCVHLSGYVQRLAKSNLRSEIKLTDTSYLTSSFADSPWAVVFRQDVDVARAIFIVGFSLSDLDIRRVLFESAALKEKCFFVMGKSPDPVTSRRAFRLGTVLNIDTAGFAGYLGKKAATYVPPKQLGPLEYCIKRFKVPEAREDASDRDVFDLLLWGRMNPSLVWGSLHNDLRYFLERSGVERALASFESGRRVVTFYSDPGNSKAAALEGLRYRAVARGFDVYTLAVRGESLFEELEVICRPTQKTLLTIDHYPDWLDVMGFLGNHRSDNLYLALTARTSAHDVMVDRLAEEIKAGEISEISVDRLDRAECEWVTDLFDEYGLWGRLAARSRRQKIKYLEFDCQAQWHATLLKQFESPQMISRLQVIFDQLNKEKEYYEAAVAILALTLIGHPPSASTLVDLCGARVLEPGFRKNAAIQELVDFPSGRVSIRSSVAAEFILRRIANPNTVVIVLSRMAKAADRAAGASRFYYDLFKRLVLFSNVQHLFPDSERRRGVLHYYELLKNLGHAKRNPLFWLQYAIACTLFEDLERAGTYFATAYSFAELMDRYDTFQIDNHYARYLLVQATRSGDAATAMVAFRKARKIIFEQIQRERLHYPYRVATAFGEFYDTFAPVFSHEQKAEIARAAKYVSDRIERLPRERQDQKYVEKCWEAMQRIIGAATQPAAEAAPPN